MKYLIILKTYFSLAYKVYVLNKKHVIHIFKQWQEDIKCDLSEEQQKRIAFYTAQSCLVASWVCALTGKKLSKEQQDRVLYVGAITPIVDDLTDTLKLTAAEILHQLKYPSNKSEKEEWTLARYLYNQLMDGHGEDFAQIFEEALVSQDASLLQLEKRKLSEAELTQIARNKGGAFVILYWAVIQPNFQPREKEVLMTLGYLLQQVNDMFDIHKDYQNGQQTLFTNSKDIQMNLLDYQRQLQQLIAQFYNLGYERDHITQCLMEIATVTSRGLVCLDQLMSLPKEGTKFDLHSFSRKQLICDMEKPSNLIKSFQCSVRFYEQMKAARPK